MNDLWNREIRVGFAVIFLALLSIFVVIPSGVDVPSNVEVRVMAPDFWPLTVSVAAAIAGGFVLIGGILEQQRRRLSAVSSMPDESVPTEKADSEYRPFIEGAVRVAGVLGVLLGLYFLIPTIGIVVGCMALLVFLIRFTGETRWMYIVTIALILPVILYAFFVYVANVPMPLGVFEQFR